MKTIDTSRSIGISTRLPGQIGPARWAPAATLALVLTTLPLNAVLLLEDTFNYPDGPLVTAPGSPWGTHSGTAGEVNVVSGRVFLTQSETEDVNAPLAGAPYSNGILYASFTFNMTNLPAGAGTYFAHFKDPVTAFKSRVFATTTGAAVGKFRLGIANGAAQAGSAAFLASDLTPGTNYRVVVRYNVAAVTNTLWVNPASESDNATRVDATDASSAVQIIGFAFRQSLSSGNGMGGLFIDDLRVGTNFLDVTAGADLLDTWHRRNPPKLPAGNNQGITFGNGTFVAVGTNALTSSDGANWTSHPLGGSYWLADVIYGNSKFVAVGNDGAVLTSPDGATWTGQSSGTTAPLAGVTYGNGLFVAVGNGGAILTSTNGTNWASTDSGVVTNLYDVAYGNGTFVAVGYESIILTSDDGLIWTNPMAPSGMLTKEASPNITGGHYSELTGVTFGDGKFVAAGTYHIEGDVGWIRYAIGGCSTNNGAGWGFQQGSSGTALSGVTYGDGTFTAVGNTGYTSTNGVSWTGSGAWGNAVGFGNGLFIAVGDNSILTSSDAVVWTSAGAVTSQRLCSVTYGDTNYVAVGFGGTVLTSSNGVAWTRQTSGTSTGLYSVAYGNGTFVAVGQIILSSSNGVDWVTRDSGLNYDYEAVAYANGAFMTVGANGAMKVSSDGISWSPLSSGTTATIYGVAYGNGTYVVVGAGGTIRSSADGLVWTSRSSGTAQDLNGVTYGGGVFVAQGSGGVVVTSINGADWTSRASGTGQYLATSAHGFGRFVVVGMNGVILASTNAADWATKTSGTSALLVGICAGPDSFIAVGDGGWILQSGSFPPLGIGRQPQSQMVQGGQTAQFSVQAWGADPPSFQWRKDGVALADGGNISGATTASVTLTNVQGTDAGGYDVVVTNAFGTVTSVVARLIVVFPGPRYVDANSASPIPLYTNWATAARVIQDAVDVALAGDEIVVTNGIYAIGGRAVSGTMTNRVAVDRAVTVRSVNGPQVTTIRGSQASGGGTGAGAIRCVYLTNGAGLFGFTVTNGATDMQGSGGGVCCSSVSAVISNCVITRNFAGLGGGACYGTLNNCTLSGNSGVVDLMGVMGAGGGAYYSTLNNCTLISNSSPCYYIYQNGGGACGGTLNNCTLTGNSASGGGAACEATLNNCVVSFNSACGPGGGAYGGTLNNCTLVGNSGNGTHYQSTLNNCIIYFNTDGGVYGWSSTLNYCCTTPMPTNGVGNITNAPIFADYAGGNLRLESNSPCINAGHNASAVGTTDLDGNPRIVGGTVDVGAYECQSPALLDYYTWLQGYGLPTGSSTVYADSDGDGHNNWQEWRCLTDPTNALSVLRLLSASPAETNVIVTWQSVAGVNYLLERSADLAVPPVFTPLATNLPGGSGTTTYTDTNAASLTPLFYRVGVGN